MESPDLAALGFKHTETGTVAGQPPYNPWAPLKLYLYGYQHGIRSRRYSLDEPNVLRQGAFVLAWRIFLVKPC